MGWKTYGYGLHMITKREKLQYAYVFLTDLVTLAVSTAVTWFVTDRLDLLLDYAHTD